jgi:hypothetical protein
MRRAIGTSGDLPGTVRRREGQYDVRGQYEVSLAYVTVSLE